MVTSSSTRLPERIKTTKRAQEAETTEIKEEEQVESRKMHRLSDLPNGSLKNLKKKSRKAPNRQSGSKITQKHQSKVHARLSKKTKNTITL